MIEFKHITKQFVRDKQTFQALNNISFTIPDGQIYGIIGYSGAGKSTLVRCINLLEKPTSGQVIVNGIDITNFTGKKLREFRKGIGMIFQQFNLMPSRTVWENIALPLENTSLSDTEIDNRISDLLDLVSITELAQSYPSQLSGGQKQRVAIARALANNPQILLCDEATSALDPKTTKAILQLLTEINQKLGITIVVITHEMDVVKEICHRVAVLEQGNLLEEDDVFTIFSNPSRQATKDYLRFSSTINKTDLFLEDEEFLKLTSEGVLVQLTYLKKTVSTPVISEIAKKFKINFNIILADIDYIDGNQIGGTVLILEGEKIEIEKTIHYLERKNVKVEVLKDGKFL